jgi:hypothetical protein
MLKILDLKNWLQGSWAFERTVQDFKHNQVGKMTGQGDFTLHQNGLLYEEQAQFFFGAYRDEVHQSYLYSFSSLSCADVFFMDGRLFHTLNLSTAQDQSLHCCGADTYRGFFKVLNSRYFLIIWNIEGPKKKMIIKTKLHKI